MTRIFNVFWVIVIVSCSLLSCKNDSENILKNAINKEIPGFYDIDFDNIFTYEDNAIDSQTIAIVKNYYNYFWQGNKLSGSILVAKGNKIIFEGYSGFANSEKNIPITAETPIHLASISKNLTAMAILKLVEAGKIKLTQTVASILPDFPYKEIRIFDLLTHRSGLGDYGAFAETEGWWNRNKFMTNNDMYKMFVRCNPPTYSKPNTAFSYCNTNYAFLALIIEKITQKPFPEAMKIMIFDPLGMENTYIFTAKELQTASFSYYQNGRKINWDYRDLIYGDKNVYSTPRDMFKYSQAMFSDKFLRKSLLDSAMTGYSNERKGQKNYGFGFRMLTFDNGKKIIFHNGWWHGNKTTFVHLPEEKITIIALGNNNSRAVYSAFTLTSIFGDFPFDFQEKDSLAMAENDTLTLGMIKMIEKAKKDSVRKSRIKVFSADTISYPRKRKLLKDSL